MGDSQDEIVTNIAVENIGGSSATSDSTPRVGMLFDSEQDAYSFYNNYGRSTGFSIRRDYGNRSRIDGVLISKKFVCSKEGEREKDKRNDSIKKHRAPTRTNCPAHMYINLDRKIGKFVVKNWEENHNHILHLAECAHMMPSQRKVSVSQGINAEMALNSGISLKASYELMSTQAGGRENLGFTQLDQKNYLHARRQRDLKYGEAGSLLGYFKSQVAVDPSFYYAVQLDAAELITNIFWADHRMIIDYGLFGDAISFDTTFRTNKEYRPLAVFVGFNHFRELVVFGAALLYDETKASFIWLFETFLHCMSGKKPITIFTDQCKKIGSAIENVFPKSYTYHALCTWHLMQNALKHCGHVFKANTKFGQDLSYCIFDCETQCELIEAWKSLLDNYEVRENKWIKKTWPVREKWARVYMKRTFTAGMRSTQLSECTNSILRRYLQPDHNITQFFTHFNRFLSDQRYKELVAEYKAREKLPNLRMKSPLLKQVGRVYTPTIFELFQEEIEKSLSVVVKQTHELDGEHHFVVGVYKKEREYFVKFNTTEATVECTCCKFEMIGFLCCHALKVLDRMGIMEIYERYILKRWRRDAKDSFTQCNSVRVNEEDPKLVALSRYRELCHRMVQLATRCSENDSAYQLVSHAIDNLCKEVETIYISKHDSEVNDNGDVGPDGTNIVDPNLAHVKGIKRKEGGYRGKQRPKPWYEKGKKKKEKAQPSEMNQVVEIPQPMPWMNQEHYIPNPPTTLVQSSLDPHYTQDMIASLTQLSSIGAQSTFLSDDFYEYLGNSTQPTQHPQ